TPTNIIDGAYLGYNRNAQYTTGQKAMWQNVKVYGTNDDPSTFTDSHVTGEWTELADVTSVNAILDTYNPASAWTSLGATQPINHAALLGVVTVIDGLWEGNAITFHYIASKSSASEYVYYPFSSKEENTLYSFKYVPAAEPGNKWQDHGTEHPTSLSQSGSTVNGYMGTTHIFNFIDPYASLVSNNVVSNNVIDNDSTSLTTNDDVAFPGGITMKRSNTLKNGDIVYILTTYSNVVARDPSNLFDDKIGDWTHSSHGVDGVPGTWGYKFDAAETKVNQMKFWQPPTSHPAGKIEITFYDSIETSWKPVTNTVYAHKNTNTDGFDETDTTPLVDMTPLTVTFDAVEARYWNIKVYSHAYSPSASYIGLSEWQLLYDPPPVLPAFGGPNLVSAIPDATVFPGGSKTFNVASHFNATKSPSSAFKYFVTTNNHALLNVSNASQDLGTFELKSLNTSGNATVTVKVVAVERDVDVWVATSTFAVSVGNNAPTLEVALPDVSG
ncbi:MAG: hypothetical protein QMC37_01215, partial [Flavobacteriales bacterium]